MVHKRNKRKFDEIDSPPDHPVTQLNSAAIPCSGSPDDEPLSAEEVEAFRDAMRTLEEQRTELNYLRDSTKHQRFVIRALIGEFTAVAIHIIFSLSLPIGANAADLQVDLVYSEQRM
jgi:hypothetical protein